MSAQAEPPGHLADLGHPDVAKSHQRSNVDCMRRALLPGETPLVVAEGNRKRFSMGLIALTKERVIYVQTRIVRRPIVWSIPVDDIENADIELEPLYGRIILELRDKTRIRFDLIRPKERVYPFLWRIREMVTGRMKTGDA